ncbi:MAG: MFS transporter, partial [Clostridia bacterium]|nr:MFS transporter [Clostridia bacterium]
MQPSYKRLKLACYTTNVTMSAVGNLSALLFICFHTLYDISYTTLGLLVLVNFVTQLAVDLVFSFFSANFNVPKTVRFTPLIAFFGLVLYALTLVIFKENIYFGLLLSTIIFASSSGLSEVLTSPTIAAIPSDDPDREMSKLHSVYAWGVVGVVVVSTLFLLIFKSQSWPYLAALFAIIPLCSFLLFTGIDIPQIKEEPKSEISSPKTKKKGLWLCVFAIFLGGAAECTMAQWCSGYLEKAMGIDKVWGDIFGVALFAAMLGLGRSLYAKRGKRIERVLFMGAIGATACYLTAALTSFAPLGLFACAFTGFCVSMMWPGMLVVASDRFPNSGVALYALMAAGGDLGASVGPALLGVVTDLVRENPGAMPFAQALKLTPDGLGMKAGLLLGMLFPLVAIFVYRKFMRK